MPEGIVPIEAQIAAAKMAMAKAAGAPKTSSPFSGEPPAVPEPPTEVVELTQRIDPGQVDNEGHLKTVTSPEGTTPEPESLAEVTWHQVGEKPSVAEHPFPTAKNGDASRPETEDVRKKRLKETAEKLFEKSTIRDLFSREFRWNAVGYGIDYTNLPEELNSLMIGLNQYGLGEQMLSGEYANVPQSITIAFRILRPDATQGRYNEDKVAYYGIGGGYPRKDAAERILAELPKNLKTVRSADLDMCVLSALACGDPYTAVRLIQSADKLLPEQGPQAVENAISRLLNPGLNSFEQARSLYPEHVKDRMDGVISSLGEGNLSGITNARAQELKNQAEERLRTRIREKRNRYLTEQQVVKIKIQEKQLEGHQLAQLVEDTITESKNWSGIESEIAVRAASVEDARVADFIASELQMRLHPELSVDTQIGIIQADATHRLTATDRKQFPYYGNGYQEVFDLKLLEQDTPQSDKQKALEGIYYDHLNTDLMGELLAPDTIGIKTMVAFLRAPDTFPFLVKNAERQLEDTFRRYAPRAGELEEAKNRFANGKFVLARKLVSGVSFLQTMADNPETRRILEQKFGFSELIRERNLEAADAKLKEMFADIVEPGSGLTLYESVLAEGQLDEDTRVVGQIAAVRPKDIVALTEAKKGETIAVVDELTSKARTDQDALVRKKEQLVAPLSEKGRLEALIASNETRLKELKTIETVRFAPQKLFKPGSLTTAEKAAEEALLQTQLEVALTQMPILDETINNIGPVSDDLIAAARQKLHSLEGLKPPASA